jgi:hypothetical protein
MYQQVSGVGVAPAWNHRPVPASAFLRPFIWPAILLAALGATLLVIEITRVEASEWMLITFPLALATVFRDYAPRWADVVSALTTIALGLGTMVALDGVLTEMWAFYAAALIGTVGGNVVASGLELLAQRRVGKG